MQLVVIEGQLPDPQVTLSATELEARDRLLDGARALTVITEAKDELAVTTAGVALKKWQNEVEAARKAIKAPVLAIGQRIDALAAEATAPVRTELERLGRVRVQWDEQERRRVAEAEAKRQAEINRLEAERKAQETEARRLQEVALESEQAGFAPVTTQAVLEAAVIAEQAATAARTATDTVICAPLPQVQRTAGSVARMETMVEVLDVRALYAAHPELCNIEPKMGAIKAIWSPGMVIPGCKIYQQAKAGFRVR